MKKRFLLTIAILVFALGVSIFSSGRTEASGDVSFEMFDSCRNVTFKMTNNRNVAVEVKQIKYYNASKGKWKTENVANGNQRCEKGATCEIGGGYSGLNYQQGEDLADAEGDRLTKIVFVYEDVNSNTRRESQQFSPSDPVCRAEKVYGHGQGWTISGQSSSSQSPEGADGACKNVSFILRNNVANAIKVTEVKYFNKMSGKWKTEEVGGPNCSIMDTTCTIGGSDDLADANNDDITKIIFVYKKSHDSGWTWGNKVESKTFVPESPKCHEGKVYGHGQGWTIGNLYGPASSASSGTTNSTSTSGSTTSDTGSTGGSAPTGGRRKRKPNSTMSNTSGTVSQTGTLNPAARAEATPSATIVNPNARRRKTAPAATVQKTANTTVNNTSGSTSSDDSGSRKRKRKKPNQ